jgi:hypothetical protein
MALLWSEAPLHRDDESNNCASSECGQALVKRVVISGSHACHKINKLVGENTEVE